MKLLFKITKFGSNCNKRWTLGIRSPVFIQTVPKWECKGKGKWKIEFFPKDF